MKKKVLFFGEKIDLNSWSTYLNIDKNDVEYCNLYEGIETYKEIENIKPDLVIFDEYFYDREYVDTSELCEFMGLEYYRISPSEEDFSKNKYNLSSSILDKINKTLIS